MEPARDSTLLISFFRTPDTGTSRAGVPAPGPNLIYYSFPPSKVPANNVSIKFWLKYRLFNAIGTGGNHICLLEPAPAPISLYYSLLSFNVLVAVSGRSQPRDPAPDSILIYDSSPSFKAPELAPEYNRILDLMTDTILFSYFLLLSNVREYSVFQ